MLYFFPEALRPNACRDPLLVRFLGLIQRRTTVGTTPKDEWSALRRDVYLGTHNTHNRQTSMPPARFEPTVSAGERPVRTADNLSSDSYEFWEPHLLEPSGSVQACTGIGLLYHVVYIIYLEKLVTFYTAKLSEMHLATCILSLICCR
jgi:hypothetical protein